MPEEPQSYGEGDPTEVTRVRQGVVSFRVITVLIISTCLALLVMGIVWLGFAPHAHHGVGQSNRVGTKTSS
jgi:hypothetical protein